MRSFEEIMQETNEIFKDVLENDTIVLTPEITADDVAEWDSLSHIQLIVEIERHFKIRFTSAEISSYQNVGKMCEGIEKKLIVNA